MLFNWEGMEDVDGLVDDENSNDKPKRSITSSSSSHPSSTGCLADLMFVVRRARARQSAPGASADQFLHFRARLLGLCCTKQMGGSWDEV
ncbi:hypothetical protein T01_3543 [Trichinella spiralis]|uniref:Uncharacterized protein n=1 Tax=Trichinella spiralis TaxID=6334 RepID=A0A0V1B6S2_TRISP|nr:hypothetical protein T01_3543 [Trichinella spiralis]